MTAIQRVSLLWAGVLVGISFIATPVKFQAPSLALSTALEVGRLTFRAMAMAEIVLSLIGIALLLSARKWRSLFLVAPLILVLEWTVVMPVLSARTDAVLAGQAAPVGNMHLVFVALEAIKIIVLLVVGLRTPRALPAESVS